MIRIFFGLLTAFIFWAVHPVVGLLFSYIFAFRFRFFIEAIFLGFIFDVLFLPPVEGFFSFLPFTTAVFLGVVLIEFVKTRLILTA